jgi:hypothetical protein
MSAVQKVWSSYVYATILLQHGLLHTPRPHDWLEEMMQDEDVKFLSEMLQTHSSMCPETPKSSNRKRQSQCLNNDDREI